MLQQIIESIAQTTDVSLEQAKQVPLRSVPFGEFGEPIDIAYMILFLSSDESKYVTGSEFQVDGGWHLGLVS